MSTVLATRSFWVLSLLLAWQAYSAPVFRNYGPDPVDQLRHKFLQSGSVNTLLVEFSPSKSTTQNRAYAGTTAGGIWATDNFVAAKPVWRPLTNNQNCTFIKALVFDIADTSQKTLWAGCGDYSAYIRNNGLTSGLLKSTDKGSTWKEIGRSTFTDTRVSSLYVRGKVILAGADSDWPSYPDYYDFSKDGLWRSTDGGATFKRATKITRPVSSIEPTAEGIFVGVPSVGVFLSTNEGSTWTDISTSAMKTDIRRQNDSTAPPQIRLSAFNTKNKTVLYALIVQNGYMSKVWKYENKQWTVLGSPLLFNSGQGFMHGAITPDIKDPTVLYVAGDVVDNSAGNVFRGSPAMLKGYRFDRVPADTAHPDCRDFAYDNLGNLVYASDGGIYRLNKGGTSWTAISNNMVASEVIYANWNPILKQPFAGLQDNGSPEVHKTGVATDETGGDGQKVSIDLSQYPSRVVTYHTAQYLINLVASTFTSASEPPTRDYKEPRLLPDRTLLTDHLVQLQAFSPIYEANRVAADRLMLIHGPLFYESFDQGATWSLTELTNLLTPKPAFGKFFEFDTSNFVYGGKINGTANADLAYAPLGNNIYRRSTLGGKWNLVCAFYEDAKIRQIQALPDDSSTVYAVTVDNDVFQCNTVTGAIQNLTSNLSAVQKSNKFFRLFAIEVISTAKGNIVVVGGKLGIEPFSARWSRCRL